MIFRVKKSPKTANTNLVKSSMPAGARPGERRGGRQKGTPNRKTMMVEDLFRSLNFEPLEEMIKVAQHCHMMIEKFKDDHAAQIPWTNILNQTLNNMTPYRHPRRSSSAISGEADAPPIQHKHEFAEIPKGVREQLRDTLTK